jgi:hypothetical protein
MLLAEMFGDLLGNRRGNSRFSGVNEADDIEQFFAHHTFQEIAFRSGGEGAPDLHVAFKGGQDNNARFRKFAANTDQSVNAAHIRHSQIH